MMMENKGQLASPRLSPRTKLALILVLGLMVVVFLLQVRVILAPFLWALLVAYLFTPIVNYLNFRGRLPRLWCVTLLYVIIGLVVLTISQYLYPRVVAQGTVFVEDIPVLEGRLITLVGPRPLGIDINSLVKQLLSSAGGYTSNAKSASYLLVNAAETLVQIFLFLVATFYLLMDTSRLKTSFANAIPESYRPELLALGRQINLTWQQYIRGELVLFAIMATLTFLALSILGVPGALFLGIVSGALELLPLIGPWTAGALAVSVGYLNGGNPFGWSDLAYAGVIALVYFVLRQAEDYVVIPNVLGRAVRLHPLVVVFAVASGGIIDGLFGLLIAVPIAASIKAIWIYLRAKLLDLPVQFEPIQTLGGGIIEIPIHGTLSSQTPEGSATEGTGAT
ncbi:MAG: AI-2E family transporter [Chloroflexota bacterium]